MTTTVKNIVKKSYPIPEDTIKLCKRLGVDKHLPTVVPRDVSFELHNSTTEMANALRRCINSELEVLIMDFDDRDFMSDDSFIIIHELKKRINLIPIRQIAGINFHINVSNNTDNIIPVYSKSIKEGKDKKSKKEIKDKIFSDTFILTYLRPGKKLLINNIHTKKGTSYKDGAMFSFPGKVGYKCLDLKESKEGEVESSMVSEPKNYRLTVPRQKHIDPIQIIKLAIKTLDTKMTNLYNLIENATENFYSSEIEVIYSKGKALFKIYGETYTIGNLLFRYGMNVDKSITNIHCIKLHPSFDYINVKVEHADSQKVMMSAITNIKKELKRIGDAF